MHPGLPLDRGRDGVAAAGHVNTIAECGFRIADWRAELPDALESSLFYSPAFSLSVADILDVSVQEDPNATNGLCEYCEPEILAGLAAFYVIFTGR